MDGTLPLPVRPAAAAQQTSLTTARAPRDSSSSYPFRMTVENIVTDPSLQPLLHTSTRALDQCLALADFLESQPLTTGAKPSDETLLALSKQQKLLYSLLAQLRGLNRNAILGIRQTKQATAEARQEIDRLHLQLQNLYYEQRHLMGEIQACESYDHPHLLLPLLDLSTFLSLFPHHAASTPHDLTVARITHEHTERESLEAARQELLKRKQSLIAENKRRKEDLANLDKDLETFIDAAQPILKRFEKEY